jgi:hypothetical protein
MVRLRDCHVPQRGSLAARSESVNQSGLLGQFSRGKASLQQIIADQYVAAVARSDNVVH